MRRDAFDVDFRDLTQGQPRISPGGPRRFEATRSRLVVLVHGNATKRKSSDASYEMFARALEASGLTDTTICRVHWPSDFFFGSGYAWMVSRATGIAKLLAPMLEQAVASSQRRVSVALVGHSLGCRLILEALDTLKPQLPQGRVRLFLMAAAVPVGLVDAEEHFRPAIRSCIRSNAYWSDADSILKNVFRVGQWAGRALHTLGSAGEARRFEDPNGFPAVGLTGRPVPLWQHPVKVPGADHGDYWTNPARFAEDVRQQLSARAPVDRKIQARSQTARRVPTRASNLAA